MTNAPQNILVVEDNPTNRKLLRVTLEAEGFTVFDAADGIAALALLEQQKIDAIISDILMPGMDGFRLCSEVRKSEKFGDLPFIIYTCTYTSPSDEKLALRVGVDKYIRKPVPVKAMVEALGEVCARPRLESRGPAQAPDESEVMKQYREVLVRKLEDTNADLTRAVSQHECLAALSQRAMASVDLAVLINEAVHLLGESLHVDYCGAWELLPDGRNLLLRAGAGWKDGLVGSATVSSGADDSRVAFLTEVLQSGQPVIVDRPDAEESTPLAPQEAKRHAERDEHGRGSRGQGILLEHGVVSGAGVAIQGSPAAWGVLSVHTTTPSKFRTEDIHFLQSVANVLAAAIDRRRAEEATKEAGERLAGIVGSAMDAIISVDAAQRIVLFNAAAEKMFRCPAAGAIGRPLDRFIPERFHAAHAEHVRAFGEDGTTSRAMGRLQSLSALRADGEEFPMEASISQVEVGGRKLFTVILRDVTERKRAEQALVESEIRFRQLANSIPQLVWIARPDGWIFWYNDRWHEYTGTTPEQTEGWGWRTVLDAQELPRVLERWQASVATGRPFDMELPLRGADGRFRWFLTRVMPFRDSGERIVLWFGTSTDITEQWAAREHLRRAKEAADAANQAKSQFLMNMSHELRTPMNSIMGMTELVLAERDLSPMARDCLQTAKDSADGLLELINQILDFSRIEAGKLQLDSRPFGLREVLDKTLKPLAIRASQKKLELTCDVDADVPNSLVGDSLALRQVLTNLVGNAIKFTHKGDIVVRVRLGSLDLGLGSLVLDHGSSDTPRNPQETQDLNPKTQDLSPKTQAPTCDLHFSVSDTGIGISPEDQERLFAPFAQVDASLSRQYGGTGLGLAVSHRLVMLAGGRTWMESNIGSGSIFHFTLRLGLQPGGGGESATAKAALTRLHNVPVLVVDDNAAGRHSLERMLAGWAMKPEVADCASAALIKLHEATAAGEPIPVVLVNAVMSGTDGFTLASWINNNRILAGSVILMIPALDRQEMAERCEQVKAIYLEKPVLQAGLLDALSRAVAGGAFVRSEPVTPEVGEISPVTTKPLRVLVAEDNPPNQKFIVFALQRRGHHVEAASNGRVALELLHRNHFDAVLMDLQMPVMDGLEATAAIRKLEQPGKARLPIIALTAHAMQGDEERCLAAGMDAYVSKPVNVGDLFAVVERLAGSPGSLV